MRTTFLTIAAAAAIVLTAATTDVTVPRGDRSSSPPFTAAAAWPAPGAPRPGPATPHVTDPSGRPSTSTGHTVNASSRGEVRPAGGQLNAAEAVAWCESRGDYRAENPDSSASGAYQFRASTWTWVTGLEPPASAWPPHVQDAAFHALWDHGAGAAHWAPSRACWAPVLDLIAGGGR